jgi:predicted nucleic acid-binding protein
MMDGKCLFIDTNILIYSSNELSPWQEAAEKALQKARDQSYNVCISQQVLREYLAGATRIKSLGETITLKMILENLAHYQKHFTVLNETRDIFSQLIDLVQEIPVAGKQIHDANIVATMLVYGIEHLLTHNIDDFKRFSKKIHLLPLEEWTSSR